MFDESREALESKTPLPRHGTYRVRAPVPFVLDTNCYVQTSTTDQLFRLMCGTQVLSVDGEEVNGDFNTFQNLIKDKKTDFNVTFSENIVILPLHSQLELGGTSSSSFERYGIRVDPNTMCISHVTPIARSKGARVGHRILKIKINSTCYYTKYYHDTMRDRYQLLERNLKSQAVDHNNSRIGIVLESHTDARLCLRSGLKKFVSKNAQTLEYCESVGTHLSMDATSVCGLWVLHESLLRSPDIFYTFRVKRKFLAYMIDMHLSRSKTMKRREQILLEETDEIKKERKSLLDLISNGDDSTKRVMQETRVLHDEPIEHLKALVEGKTMELEQLTRDFRGAVTREDRKIAQVDRAHVKDELKLLRQDLEMRLERRKVFIEQYESRKRKEEKMYQERLSTLTERQHDVADQMSLLDVENVESTEVMDRYRRHLEHIDAVLRESERLNPLTNAATGLKHYLVEHRLPEKIRELSGNKTSRCDALLLAQKIGGEHTLMKISKWLKSDEQGNRFLKSLVKDCSKSVEMVDPEIFQ